MTDSNSDGTIVNPGASYDPELDHDAVGDVADEANDLRFNEEEVLIREQAQAREVQAKEDDKEA